MICNCSLAGTIACNSCSHYLNHFGPIPKEPTSQSGWICSKCGASLSPYVSICHCGQAFLMPKIKYRLIADEIFEVIDDYPPGFEGKDNTVKFFKDAYWTK